MFKDTMIQDKDTSSSVQASFEKEAPKNLTLGFPSDPFALLGLTPCIDLDPELLENRYYEAQKRCHPDLGKVSYGKRGGGNARKTGKALEQESLQDNHTLASSFVKNALEELSAKIHGAFTILKDPFLRANYFLETWERLLTPYLEYFPQETLESFPLQPAINMTQWFVYQEAWEEMETPEGKNTYLEQLLERQKKHLDDLLEFLEKTWQDWPFSGVEEILMNLESARNKTQYPSCTIQAIAFLKALSRAKYLKEELSYLKTMIRRFQVQL
jgi:curved DNA-binding protein CbpA